MIGLVGSNMLEKLSSKCPSLELSRILHWPSLHFVLLLPSFGLCTDAYPLPGLAKMSWYEPTVVDYMAQDRCSNVAC